MNKINEIFLYVDVFYLPSLTGAGLKIFELAFNDCTRHVYGLGRFDHISEFSREILGCIFFDWLVLFIR
jgi:hypothetical protein